MTEEQKMIARDRIIETAVSLFAQRGYSAVGVREIAENAGVNISMISYYYNGKIGILKKIFENFHSRYLTTLHKSIEENVEPEACLEAIIHGMIDFIRANHDLTMVAFNTIPLDIPELNELKSERIHRLIETVGVLFHRLGLDPDDIVLFASVGPSLMAMVLAHFQFRQVQEKVLNITFDEAFYERYKNIITNLVLHGIPGMAARMNESQGV